MLEKLKKLNPQMNFFSVFDKEFNEYGRIIELDSKDIIDAAKNIPMPESGSKYEATTAAFEELPVAKTITEEYFGQLDVDLHLV